jgi:hypothetical protein
VPEDFLSKLVIPVPPLAEQNRIIAIVRDRFAIFERVRGASEERLHMARQLPDALLRSAFQGTTPLTAAAVSRQRILGWEWKPLRELALEQA